MRFRERLARFMAGRYGVDALYRFTMWTCVALVLVSLFLRPFPVAYLILSSVETLLFIWTLFRCFSRNIEARQRENIRFWRIRERVRGFFRLCKNRRRDRKTHVYKKCPHCRSTLRLPKQKGRHSVRCPRCRTLFSVKI